MSLSDILGKKVQPSGFYALANQMHLKQHCDVSEVVQAIEASTLLT